ncbi:AHH domain-containing protein [Aurantivibrio plasticivorans]
MHQPSKSLLDIALDNYDIQASRYFTEQNELKNLPADVRKKRDKEHERTKRLLDSQRMNAEAVASIQAKLDEYRDQGKRLVSERGATGIEGRKVLEQEKHHPTRKLGRYMIADGNPKPSPEHAAHHIVPGKGRTQEPYRARAHMHTRGIRINDPDNGVWLPRYKKHTPHWSMPEALSHLEYHTIGYETRVSQAVRRKQTESQIRSELRFIAKLLQENKFPV